MFAQSIFKHALQTFVGNIAFHFVGNAAAHTLYYCVVQDNKDTMCLWSAIPQKAK